jgi:hypothetical protein
MDSSYFFFAKCLKDGGPISPYICFKELGGSFFTDREFPYKSHKNLDYELVSSKSIACSKLDNFIYKNKEESNISYLSEGNVKSSFLVNRRKLKL